MQKKSLNNRRVKTKDVFSIKNSSSRENLVKSSSIKNPSKFELEDIEVDEIRDYKKKSWFGAELNVGSLF